MKTLSQENQNKEMQRVWNFFMIAILIGLFLCFLLGLKSVQASNTFKQALVPYLQVSVTCLLISGASFGIGSMSGFLFGIPKIINPEGTGSAVESERRKKYISQNDNLVQISDWLTKIIVGVGLTQLYNIPDYLRILGEYFSSIFHNNFSGNVAISIILYFLVIGFLFAYVWVRLYFTEMIQKVEESLEKEIVNKLELQEQNVKAIAEALNDTQQKMTEIGGGKTLSENLENVKADIKNKTTDNISLEDPQKGNWGGKTENNDRKITARIELSDISGYYKVTLEVSSINPLNPLTGVVKFYLHPSFNNSEPIIAVTDGTATLVLNTVYGAFTAGAEADDGKTKLEIDLAELPNAPQDFKER